MSEATMPMPDSDRNTLARTIDFEGHPVSAVKWRERWCWPAAEVGEAIGYEQGRRIVAQINGPWSSEFHPGEHFMMLKGADLKEFRELCTASVQTSKYAGRMMVLTEAGIDLALLKTETDKGKRLRAFLVDYVLPQLRQTGRVDLRPANEVFAAQMDLVRQSLTQQAQLVEMMRHILARLDSGPVGGVIGEAIAREAIEIPVESAIETHAHSKKTQRSLRRSIYNRLQSAVQFTGPNCEWANLPVSQLARAQRALSGMLKEVPDRAAKLDARNGVLGPLFDKGAKKRARKPAKS